MKLPTKRLIIWRSLVQAQAGPRFYYSDLRFGVGRCFWFTKKELGWTTLQTPCAMKCNTIEDLLHHILHKILRLQSFLFCKGKLFFLSQEICKMHLA